MNQKTALITGASRGIGRAISLSLASQGYHLMLVCHRNLEMLEDLKHHIEMKYPVTCFIFTGDMGNYETVQEMYRYFLKHFHSLDVIVNNAGISHVGLLTDMEPDEWDHILQTNLSSAFYICRYGIPIMLKKKAGKIINISSVWGVTGASCEVAYSATKGGLNSLTKALAKELAPSNIQVNAIACGAIDTDMNNWMKIEDLEALLLEIPAGRFGRPDEVAKLVLDLSADHAYLTGQIIQLDGGWI